MRSTCIPSSSPDWLVRATSSLFERRDALAPAHRLWANTSGPASKEVGAQISRWGHTRTHSAAEMGATEKGSAGPRPDTASLSAHEPAATPCSFVQLGLLLAQPLLDAAVSLSHLGQEQCQLRSQRPCPDSKWAMLCADHGPRVCRGHARTPAHAACVTSSVTRGSQRVLVTGW